MKKNKNAVFILNMLSFVVLFNPWMLNRSAVADAPIVINESGYNVSPPVSTLPSQSQDDPQAEVRPYTPPVYDANSFSSPGSPTSPKLKSISLPIKGFQGAGIGLGTYQPTVSPPDTNGAAGPTQYVQWINPGFAVFDKATGKVLDGYPKSGAALFTGTGGLCATTNRGDGVVKYDQLANRWVITKFAFPDRNVGPFAQCVAVSLTSDATGSYYVYEFPFDSLNDYGKLGMWSDGYYLTLNMVGPKTFGPRLCALDRQAMLQGRSFSMQCFQLDFLAGAAILPADLDGKMLPPAGTPEFFLTMQKPNILKLYKAKIDFNNPQNSGLTGPEPITVANFTMPCEPAAGDNCADQPGTTMKLDTLSDRLMQRLSYRQFSDHGSLLATHTVLNNQPTPTSMIRWYEIRFNNGSLTPTLYQTGNHMIINNGWGFVGSIAMDKFGNIALGYSKSSSTLFPTIGVSARLANAPLGEMSVSANIIKGTGSQIAGTRWGDYSGMSIDPVDDCTFWYTNEYMQANALNWSTYIASFKMPGC